MLVILPAAVLLSLMLRVLGWGPVVGEHEMETWLTMHISVLILALFNGGTLIGPWAHDQKMVWSQMWKSYLRWTFGGVAIRYVVLVAVLYPFFGPLAFLLAALAVASDPLVTYIADSLNSNKGPEEEIDGANQKNESGSNDGLGAPILKVVLLGVAAGLGASIITMIVTILAAAGFGLLRKLMRTFMPGWLLTLITSALVVAFGVWGEHSGIVYGYLLAWVSGYFASGKPDHSEHVMSEELENIATLFIATSTFSVLRLESMLSVPAFLASLAIFLGRFIQAKYEYPGDIRRQLAASLVGTAGLAVIGGAILWCRLNHIDSMILEGMTLWGFLYGAASLYFMKGKN